VDTPASRTKLVRDARGKNSPRTDGLRRLSGWQVQWRVVDALVYRELRTRVSDVKGGFLGVLMQPLGLIVIWLAFLAVLNIHRGGSLNVFLFLSSGIVLFTIFSQITSRSLVAMEANEALLFYKPVKPIDTVIARNRLVYMLPFGALPGDMDHVGSSLYVRYRSVFYNHIARLCRRFFCRSDVHGCGPSCSWLQGGRDLGSSIIMVHIRCRFSVLAVSALDTPIFHMESAHAYY
jgi:hypothetical protein